MLVHITYDSKRFRAANQPTNLVSFYLCHTAAACRYDHLPVVCQRRVWSWFRAIFFIFFQKRSRDTDSSRFRWTWHLLDFRRKYKDRLLINMEIQRYLHFRPEWYYGYACTRVCLVRVRMTYLVSGIINSFRAAQKRHKNQRTYCASTPFSSRPSPKVLQLTLTAMYKQYTLLAQTGWACHSRARDSAVASKKRQTVEAKNAQENGNTYLT